MGSPLIKLSSLTLLLGATFDELVGHSQQVGSPCTTPVDKRVVHQRCFTYLVVASEGAST